MAVWDRALRMEIVGHQCLSEIKSQINKDFISALNRCCHNACPQSAIASRTCIKKSALKSV